MKKIAAVLTITLLAAAPARADINIGFIAPLTGQQAVVGEQLRRGAEQAVADINAKGGVNGEKLKLQQADDACDPKQAVAASSKLISLGIKYIDGHLCSGSAIPASKTDMDEGVLLVSPGASNPRLTDEAKDLVFRTYGRDDREGAFLGNYLAQHFHDKKIAIADDNSAYGHGMAMEVKKSLNANGLHEVLLETFVPGERDYSSFISKLKQAGTQVVVLGGYHTEIGLMARQMKEQQASIQIAGGNDLTTGELWSIAGPAAEGILFSYINDPRKNPEAQSAAAAIRKSGFEPDGFTLNSYAAIQVIAEGIRRAGKDPMKVASALRQQPPITTVLGPISYDAKGDIDHVNYQIYRWHNGKYVEVEG